MSLEKTVQILVRNLPNSIDIIDLFNTIYFAFGWDFDRYGKKPVGFDYYFTNIGILSQLRMDIEIRIRGKKIDRKQAITGVIDKGSEVGSYRIHFEIKQGSLRFYSRTFRYYSARLKEDLCNKFNLSNVEVERITKS